MAVLSREQLLARISELVEDTSNEQFLAVLDDVSDTYDAQTPDPNQEDWKKKYEDNDKQWRERYRDRFFGKSSDPAPDVKVPLDDDDKDPEPVLTFDNLFKEKED